MPKRRSKRTRRSYKKKGRSGIRKVVASVLKRKTETKQFVQYLNPISLGSNFNTSPAAQLWEPLNAIVKGDEAFNREGAEINLESITFKFITTFPKKISSNIPSSASYGMVKYMLCSYPQFLTNGTILNPQSVTKGLENFQAALFQTSDNTEANNTARPIISFFDNQRSLVKVLRTKTVRPSQQNADQSVSTFFSTMRVNLKGMRIKYDQHQGGDVPQYILSKTLGVWCCSTQTTNYDPGAATDDILSQCSICVRYKDY